MRNWQLELVPTEVFRCGKCGAVLFRKDQLLIHKPFEHKLAFEKTKRVSRSEFVTRKDKHPAHGCLSYFLKACPPWVKHQDQIEAKIYCPNCSMRLGMLKWQGEQCSYILFVFADSSFTRYAARGFLLQSNFPWVRSTWRWSCFQCEGRSQRMWMRKRRVRVYILNCG